MEIQASSVIKNSSDLKDCITNISTEYKNIIAYIADLKEGWKGDRATKFYNAVENTYLPEISQAIDSISKYYDFISKVPKAYETLDNSYANKNIDV